MLKERIHHPTLQLRIPVGEDVLSIGRFVRIGRLVRRTFFLIGSFPI